MEKTGLRITYALLVIQSLFSAAMIMGFTIGSIIAVELAGGNEQWTGVPSTLAMLGAASIAYPIGYLIDRFGYRRGLSVGYFLGIIGMLLASLAVIWESLGLFLTGIIGLGFARGAAGLGRYAAADASLPHRRGRAISIVVLGGTVGSVGGPVLIDLTSKLAASFNLPPMSGPWLVGSLCFVIALIIANIFLRPDPLILARQLSEQEAPSALRFAGDRGRSFSEIMREEPLARLGVSAMIFGQMAMVLVMVVTPVYMHGHQQQLSEISFVIMAHTFGMFGLSFVTGWLIDRLSGPVIIIIGCLILGIACLIAPFSQATMWLAMALFLLGLGWNFCYVAGSTLLSDALQTHEKGRIQGLSEMLVNLASGTGSLSSGLIYAAVGFWVMSWLAILISIPPALQVFTLRRRARQAAAPPLSKSGNSVKLSG